MHLSTTTSRRDSGIAPTPRSSHLLDARKVLSHWPVGSTKVVVVDVWPRAIRQELGPERGCGDLFDAMEGAAVRSGMHMHATALGGKRAPDVKTINARAYSFKECMSCTSSLSVDR
jgi:hypothetical protein